MYFLRLILALTFVLQVQFTIAQQDSLVDDDLSFYTEMFFGSSGNNIADSEFLFNAGSMDEFIENLHILFHEMYKEDMGAILTKKEKRIFDKIKVQSNSEFNAINTPVRVSHQDMTLTFNTDFFIRFLNQLFFSSKNLHTNGAYSEFVELYNNSFQFLLKDQFAFNYLYSGFDWENVEDLDVFMTSMFSIAITLFFIEMHELYHLVYESDQRQFNNEQEIKADSFALSKIYKFLFGNSSFSDAYIDEELIQDSIGIEGLDELLGSKEGLTASIMMNSLTIFDFMNYAFNKRSYIYKNTIEDLRKRQIEIFNNIYRLVECESSPDVHICNALNEFLDNDNNLNIEDYEIELSHRIDTTSVDNINTDNSIDVFLKISQLLLDDELSEALGLAKKTLLSDSHNDYYNEYLNFLIALMEFNNFNYEPALGYLKNAEKVSQLCPADLYSDLRLNIENSLLTDFESVLVRYDSLYFKQYKKENFDFESIVLFKLPYDYNLVRYMEPREVVGVWNGKTIEDDETIPYVNGDGVFISEAYGDVTVVYKGETDNGEMHGSGMLLFFVKDSLSETIRVNYMISEFGQSKINGFTFFRLNGKNKMNTFGTFNNSIADDYIFLRYNDNDYCVDIIDEDFFSTENIVQADFSIFTNKVFQSLGPLMSHPNLGFKGIKCLTSGMDDLLYLNSDFTNSLLQILDDDIINRSMTPTQKYNYLEANILEKSKVMMFPFFRDGLMRFSRCICDN